MPLCKNDPKRKYKGDEPSPKGLGWCAHGEKEGRCVKVWIEISGLLRRLVVVV